MLGLAESKAACNRDARGPVLSRLTLCNLQSGRSLRSLTNPSKLHECLLWTLHLKQEGMRFWGELSAPFSWVWCIGRPSPASPYFAATKIRGSLEMSGDDVTASYFWVQRHHAPLRTVVRSSGQAGGLSAARDTQSGNCCLRGFYDVSASWKGCWVIWM